MPTPPVIDGLRCNVCHKRFRTWARLSEHRLTQANENGHPPFNGDQACAVVGDAQPLDRNEWNAIYGLDDRES